MSGNRCKGDLAGMSVDTVSCRREVMRDGKEGCTGDCKEGWTGKERSMGANRNLQDTEYLSQIRVCHR